jgi:hypothetical protein
LTSYQEPLFIALPKVEENERPTGNTIQSSFDNTYNLPNNTADNQTEQNLFSVNKDTSQHIQISADPSTSTASHDYGLILLIR